MCPRGVPLLSVLCLVLLGCGEARVVVSGTVTVDGKPVDEGSINFSPLDGQGPSTGGKIENGKYELKGDAAATPGKKRVSITGALKTGRRIPAGQPLPPETMIDEIIPYPDLGEMNKDVLMNVEVAPGRANQINFDLKSKKN